jgi:hypothetical protein
MLVYLNIKLHMFSFQVGRAGRKGYDDYGKKE